MPAVDIQQRKFAHASDHKNLSAALATALAASVCALAILSAGTSPVAADSLSRSIDVEGTPAAVWSAIGPFCAIQDWLPPIGTCVEDGKTPPTRTLVTRDGAATFVETQTARNDARHFYSYAFRSSPMPVTHYNSTIEVTAKGQGNSTITWSSTYTPDRGKEKEATDTLSRVYESGLNAIKARFAK
ncbi:MAG TPA: SRPBCC family protein [Dongiaceae bacterium]